MEELKRPAVVNVEEFFNEYVEFFGGQIISKSEQNLLDRPNADYLFKSQNVIAELKCFQKDLFNNEEDVSRMLSFLGKWEKQKLIKRGDKIKLILGQIKFPQKCYSDLVNSCIKTIDRAIYKANKQIEASKKTFSLPTAKGLVLLCNDGNYFLEHAVLIGLIANLMHRKYLESDIDGFVYFTINQVSKMPGSELDWTLWTPSYRERDDIVFANFVNELGDKFQGEFYTIKTGIKSSDKIIINDGEESVNLINKMRHIPKDEIYKRK